MMNALALTLAAALVLQPAPGRHAGQTEAVVRSHLVWADRTGKRLETLGDLADFGNLELSPDGRRVAVAVLDPAVGTRDLWIYEVADGRRAKLRSTPADENWLIWSPDGRRVAYNTFSPDRIQLRVSAWTGIENAGPDDLLLTDDEGVWPVSWSPDGRYILYVRNSRTTGNDIWVLPLGRDRKPYPFLQTRFQENWAAFSPDGRWIAYSSTESGQAEVYVTPFPPTARKWLISNGGGSQARWRRDGRELYYLGFDRKLMAVEVDGRGADFEVGRVSSMFEIRLPYAPYHAFDVARDGQRFILNSLLFASGGPGAPSRVAGD
jgi:dipeptidyl aminopeptidase/acylaminoacyl peptidase